MKKYATIIGSRNITDGELKELKAVAELLHIKGYTLRSGGAEGADSAINHLENVEIIIPWNNFNGLQHDGKRIFVLSKLNDRKLAKETIMKVHPAPEKLSQGALLLHMRNVYQITGVQGVNRLQLSERVIYIADENNGKVKGGTATAVKIAKKLGVHTLNLRK